MVSHDLTMPRLRVALIAYCCTPGLGSEEGVGWGWTIGLSKIVDITLITRSNNVPAIKRGLEDRNITNVKVFGCDLPYWMRFWKRGGRGAMAYHYLWQLLAARCSAEHFKHSSIDLVHHLNFSVSWQPCWAGFTRKCVVGPIDGLGMIEPVLWSVLNIRNILGEIVRGSIIWCGEHLDPFNRISFYRCGVMVCRTRFIADRLNDTLGIKADYVIPDTGLDIEDIAKLTRLSNRSRIEGKIKIIFLGRLIARKGVGLAIKSFAKIAKRYNNVELIIIGDGPERTSLKRMSKILEIEDKVTFTGKLLRDKAWDLLSGGDIFLYPSLRDAVATVVLEAMACGLPVICLNGTGPAQVVEKDIGIVVEKTYETEIIDGLASAINRLIEDEELRRRMGKAAQDSIAKKHTWEARSHAMMKVYLSKNMVDKNNG